MRILTKKKQDEILKLLAANEIIAINGLKPEYFDSFGDNSINVVYAIGGIKGLQKVKNTLKNYLRQVSRNDYRLYGSSRMREPRSLLHLQAMR